MLSLPTLSLPPCCVSCYLLSHVRPPSQGANGIFAQFDAHLAQQQAAHNADVASLNDQLEACRDTSEGYYTQLLTAKQDIAIVRSPEWVYIYMRTACVHTCTH